jgi:hypothetical protein
MSLQITVPAPDAAVMEQFEQLIHDRLRTFNRHLEAVLMESKMDPTGRGVMVRRYLDGRYTIALDADVPAAEIWEWREYYAGE